MKKQVFLIILFHICGFCKGQNLVPNPSFEVYDTCPNYWDQLYLLNNWTKFNTGSPDYYNSCDNSNFAGVPNNITGFQLAASGQAYIGVVTYTLSGDSISSYREFVGNELISPLVIGTKYFVTMKVALALGDTSFLKYSSNSQCVLFTTSLYTVLPLPYNPLPNLNFAHLRNLTIINDTANWTTLSWTFIADSSYQYIVLGNFFKDSLTNAFLVNTSSSAWVPEAYYYIDDVCVSTDSLTCNSTVGIKELSNSENISVFPNPFQEEFQVTFSSNQPVSLTIVDFTGRKVFNKSFVRSTEINTSYFSKGIYIYEMRSNNGIIKTGKLIKD